MSNAALNAVFAGSASTGANRLVLIAMADEASTDGYLAAYARSHQHLARKANVDKRTVGRAITALVQLGEVQLLKRGNGRDQADYRIVLPGLPGGPPVVGWVGEPPTPATAARRPRVGDSPTPSSPSTPVSPNAPLGRQPAAPAAASLPGLDDPQPVDKAVDAAKETERLAWQLVRVAYDARDRKPIESRKTTAATVVRLLDAGWGAVEIGQALRDSPAWTPTSIQVELARGGRQPGHRRYRPPQDDPRRQGESRVVNVAEEMRRRGR